jgi:hypothetical protein
MIRGRIVPFDPSPVKARLVVYFFATDSTVLCHAYLAAELAERAAIALGPDTGANILAEGDEEAIDLDPVAPGKELLERGERLLGAPRHHISPAIYDPMDMNVNADALFSKGDAEDQVGAFVTDAAEAHQHLSRAGERAAELLDNPPGDLMNLPRLWGVEGDRVDERVDLGWREADHRLGRARDREEGAGHGGGGLVPGAGREDARDELLKGGAIALLRQLEHRGLPQGANGSAKSRDHFIDVERPLFHGAGVAVRSDGGVHAAHMGPLLHVTTPRKTHLARALAGIDDRDGRGAWRLPWLSACPPGEDASSPISTQNPIGLATRGQVQPAHDPNEMGDNLPSAAF